MKPKIYLETTVVSYYTSQMSRDIVTAAHQQMTREWWDQQLDRYKPYISGIVYEEIKRGDPEVAKKRIQAVEEFDYLEINSEVLKLAKVYFKALDLPDKSRLDTLHLALVVQHGMDYLLNWNFVQYCRCSPRKNIRRYKLSKKHKESDFMHAGRINGGILVMKDKIVDEVRKIRKEIELENKSDWPLILLSVCPKIE
jgi:hypothetical protein